MAESDVSPKANQKAAQSVAGLQTDKPVTKEQAAWLRFLDKVERGDLKDLMGQYVSKATQVEDKKDGARSTRPKFDAALANYPAWYGVQVAKEVQEASTAGASYLYPPTDPCDGCGGGSPAPTPVYTNFESSETRLPISSYTGSDNPNGYIMDLKVGEPNTFGPGTSIPDAYTNFTIDLNKGAGGKYIYLGFTRKPVDVANNPEGKRNLPVRGITSTSKHSVYDTFPYPYPYGQNGFNHIWDAHDVVTSGNGYTTLDLNDGAGGEYIFAFQTKEPTSGPLYNPTAVEVGVLYGNSSSIKPPSGWTITTGDLNAGAGGDFIYLCTKGRF